LLTGFSNQIRKIKFSHSIIITNLPFLFPYKILSRFVNEEFEYINGLLLKPIQRDFEWRGELCQLIIIPGSVEDDDGQNRHYFPGWQEEQVETALIELAAQDKNSFSEEEKKFAFTSKQLEKHLAAGDIHLSQKQIQRSIRILSGADFTMSGWGRKWMFKLIDILITYEKKSDVQFIAYLGDLIVEEIKKYKLNQS
jgi:hypothetical protein